MVSSGNPIEGARKARELALDAGFDAVGLARLSDLRDSPEGARVAGWLDRGEHGTMLWMDRTRERRLHPDAVLPGARTVLSVAMDYGFREPDPPPGLRGVVARYARGRDYHKVFSRRLRALERRLTEAFPGIRTKPYADTGPVLEKLWAERAGLGWRGKHTNLVSRERGSWFLLGEILLDLDLVPDAPEEDHCGTCTRCIDACPTGAIVGPYRLDARRCISYLTIEHRGFLPRDLRAAIGNRVFGCDDCLAACPWNRFAQTAREADFRPRPGSTAPLLDELVSLTESGFLARFAGTALLRAKREGLARNACVALGNSGDPAAIPVLIRALRDASPVVRGHAAWALGRFPCAASRDALRASLPSESDAEALREMEEALGELEAAPAD